MTVGLASVALFGLLVGLSVLVLDLYARPTGDQHRLVRVLACGALFSVGLVSYALGGDVFGGDAPSHTARTWLFADILSRGEIPIWTNRWYLGYPIGHYFGFLYYLLTGAAALVTGFSASLVTKVALLGLHTAGAFSFFRLAKSLGEGTSAALFATLFYTYSFQHLGIIVVAGALPLSVLFLTLPALLQIFDDVSRDESLPLRRAVPQATALVALLVFNHIQYALYAVTGVTMVAAIRMVLAASRGDGNTARRLAVFVGLTGGLVMLATAWLIVPMLFEQRHLVASSDRLVGNLVQQGTWAEAIRAVRRLTVVSREADWLHFYLGLVPLCVVVVAVAKLGRRPSRMSLVQAGYVWMLIGSLPLALTSRFISVWFTLAAVVSVWGGAGLPRRMRFRKRPLPAALLAIVLLLAECSLTIVQRGYRSMPDAAATPTGTQTRSVLVEPSEMSLWRSLDVVVTGRSSLTGGIPQAAPRSYAHIVGVVTNLAADVLDRRPASLQPLTRDALRMLNVGTVGAPAVGYLQTIDDATPALFAVQVVVGDASLAAIEQESWVELERRFVGRSFDRDAIDGVVAVMGLTPQSAVARRIVMHPTLVPEGRRRLALESHQAERPSFAVRDFRETHSRVDLTYRASAAGAIQLAYSYFPFLVVRVDGQEVQAYPSAFGLIVIAAPAGEHSVSVEAGVSALTRRGLFLASAAAVAALVWFSSGPAGRRTIGRSSGVTA